MGLQVQARGLILGLVSPTFFTNEGNRNIASFKPSEDDIVELFYKEDEQPLYCSRKRSAKYVEG